MKKYYYFSEKSLEFVEIKNIKGKFLFYFAFIALAFITLSIGAFSLVKSVTYSGGNFTSLENENRILKAKLVELADQYESLQSNLEDLGSKTEHLRIAANLNRLSEDEKLLGVGGGSFDNLIDFISSPDNIDINEAFNFVDRVSKQFEFEKSQYTEISQKMKSNEDLFESIPAIMPTKGEYESSHFGMRKHPILKVWKKHFGIDFVTDIGTPVYAPGKGRVIFVGRRGGYGVAIEIDHGYGY